MLEILRDILDAVDEKLLVRILLYVFLLTVAAGLSVTGIHEAAHAATALWSGCENVQVVLYDSTRQWPYTRMMCSIPAGIGISLAGVIVSSVFAGLFFFVDEPIASAFGYAVLGWSILFGQQDYVDAGISTRLLPIVLIVVWGLIEQRFVVTIVRRMMRRNHSRST